MEVLAFTCYTKGNEMNDLFGSCFGRCNGLDYAAFGLLAFAVLLAVGLLAWLAYHFIDEIFSVNNEISDAVVTFKTGYHEDPTTFYAGAGNGIMVPIKTGGGQKYKIVAKIKNETSLIDGHKLSMTIGLVAFSEIMVGTKVRVRHSIGRFSGQICSVELEDYEEAE